MTLFTVEVYQKISNYNAYGITLISPLSKGSLFNIMLTSIKVIPIVCMCNRTSIICLKNFSKKIIHRLDVAYKFYGDIKSRFQPFTDAHGSTSSCHPSHMIKLTT